MTDLDTTPAPTPTLSPEAFRATLAGYDATNAGLRDANKAALFAALAAAGLTQVVVTFDGYGDSGQIESVEAKTGDDPADLPDTTVAVRTAEWGNPEPVACDLPVAELIERLAYDCLGDTHGGWEIGDGAFGELLFDIAAGTITLDYDERYTATNTYTHTF